MVSRVAGGVASEASGLLGFAEGAWVWEEALAAEPGPWLTLAGEQIDRALAAMGCFADLVSPYHSGHSGGVADLAAAAAALCVGLTAGNGFALDSMHGKTDPATGPGMQQQWKTMSMNRMMESMQRLIGMMSGMMGGMAGSQGAG